MTYIVLAQNGQTELKRNMEILSDVLIARNLKKIHDIVSF